MLTFIVFVFSILLVVVQLASAQLTPRIIASVYRSRVLKFALTAFVFAFTFTLDVLSRIEDSVPQVSGWLAAYSSVACIGVFLYMIDNVGKALRPVSVLTRIGSAGHAVIEDVYPRPVTGTADTATNVALVPAGERSRTVATLRTGVVLAFDVGGLVDLARRADCLIVFVPHVGDFVASGDPLFWLYGGGEGIGLRRPGDHRDPALRQGQHPDRPRHAGHAGEPDRGRTATASRSAARGTRTPEPRSGTRLP